MYALTFDVSRKGAPCSITSMIHITPKRKYKIQQLIHEETAWYADLREETCYDSSTGCVPKYHKPEPSRYIISHYYPKVVLAQSTVKLNANSFGNYLSTYKLLRWNPQSGWRGKIFRVLDHWPFGNQRKLLYIGQLKFDNHVLHFLMNRNKNPWTLHQLPVEHPLPHFQFSILLL